MEMVFDMGLMIGVGLICWMINEFFFIRGLEKKAHEFGVSVPEYLEAQALAATMKGNTRKDRVETLAKRLARESLIEG